MEERGHWFRIWVCLGVLEEIEVTWKIENYSKNDLGWFFYGFSTLMTIRSHLPVTDGVTVLSSLILPWNQKPPILSAIIAHSKCPPQHTHTHCTFCFSQWYFGLYMLWKNRELSHQAKEVSSQTSSLKMFSLITQSPRSLFSLPPPSVTVFEQGIIWIPMREN